MIASEANERVGAISQQQQQKNCPKNQPKNVPIFDAYMIWTKFGCKWTSGSGEEDFLIPSIYFGIPVEKGMTPHLNKPELPSPSYAFVPSLVEIGQMHGSGEEDFLKFSLNWYYFSWKNGCGPSFVQA